MVEWDGAFVSVEYVPVEKMRREGGDARVMAAYSQRLAYYAKLCMLYVRTRDPT